MKLIVQPIDSAGHLWMIASSEPSRPHDARRAGTTRAQLHMSTRTSVVEAAVRALRAGGAVSLFARDATFTSDLQSIAARFGELHMPVDWEWTDAQLALREPIDDAQAALEWFIRNGPELLVVGSATFEKRAPSA